MAEPIIREDSAHEQPIPRGKFIDLTGQCYERLTVLCQAGRYKGNVVWQCRCDCGTIRNITSNSLRTGNTKSCGCYHSDATTARSLKHGASPRSGWTPEFRAWVLMRQRCGTPTNKAYRYYGARGIRVCERWQSFEAFLADMGPKPSRKHSIERINNDGPYSPENCRWATQKEQANNKRNNRLITAFGATKTLAQWAEEKGVDGRLIQSRIDTLGWDAERAIAAPIRPNRRSRKL